MHPLLINAEDDHRRRTLEPSATNRKLASLERQRAKLVAILAIHCMSKTRRARLRARLATIDEMIGLVRRIVHYTAGPAEPFWRSSARRYGRGAC